MEDGWMVHDGLWMADGGPVDAKMEEAWLCG